jgi:hypothetical protein
LLVDGLDAEGTVVEQRLVWLLPPDLTARTRQYFLVPMRPAATRYRVSVYSFDGDKVPSTRGLVGLEMTRSSIIAASGRRGRGGLLPGVMGQDILWTGPLFWQRIP